MSYNTGRLLGRIQKTQGRKGAVTVRLEKNFTDKIPVLKSVFLEIEGKPVPFFVTECEIISPGSLILKFEAYESPDTICEFNGCRIFLDASSDKEEAEEEVPDLTGFRLNSSDRLISGIITEVIVNPAQWLLNVKTDKEKHILIPFHEDLITKIDLKQKLIVLELPDGLKDIN